MKKIALGLVLGIAVLILGFFALNSYIYNEKQGDQNTPTQILSFEDCERAGYPVMESYPRQCRVPDGRVYAEEILVSPTYQNASANLIVVDTPQPGSVTGKEVVVKGKARGYWYFEASFPVELRDANGKVLQVLPAQAMGEWMTEEFVPFSITLKAPQSYIGPATLVLMKDNPSGLPENDASISIPITIEY
ncbi:MAG: hypothetical protein AB202_02265 [Parcubacteria bacterium C7867-007]|nr:MAG: hypothetical protein AB202_02265 [Parcubacteria bacterium C7867-007]